MKLLEECVIVVNHKSIAISKVEIDKHLFIITRTNDGVNTTHHPDCPACDNKGKLNKNDAENFGI